MSGPAPARPPRPAPRRTEDSERFWAEVDDGRLVAQRCGSCQRWRHPPRPMCPHCRSTDVGWWPLAGRGVVYSYTILHHPPHPAFEYPLVGALVDLDEGVRLLANLVEVAPADVRIDLPVELVFWTDGPVTLPMFRPQADPR